MPEVRLKPPVDDSAIQRWMSLEFGSLQKALVVETAPLAELLTEPQPTRKTRGGTPHEYDLDALQRLDADLASPWLRRRLKLPLTFYLDKDLPGQAYAQDPAAIDAIQRLGRATTEPRNGKLFLSEPLARQFARDYPTLAQFILF